MHSVCNILRRAVLLLGVLGLFLPAWAAADIVVKDDRGATLRFAAVPQRIVSLVPSLSESLCHLGGCARIVGTDRYSNYPAALVGVAKVGEITDPDFAQIVALRPDVVVTSYVPRLAERFEALGIRVILLDLRTQGDVARVLGVLGRLLGVADPDAAWRQIDARIARAALQVPAAMRGVSVYYEFDSSLFAAGEASFIGESLARFGVRNVVPASLGLFPRLSPDYVLRADPQLIMVPRRYALSLPKRPGWERLRAVREHRICWFTEAQSDVLSRPGPRLGEAAEILAACLKAAAAGPIRPPARANPASDLSWP